MEMHNQLNETKAKTTLTLCDEMANDLTVCEQSMHNQVGSFGVLLFGPLHRKIVENVHNPI